MALAIFTGCISIEKADTIPSAGEVEDVIRSELQPGADLSEIEAFIAAKGQELGMVGGQLSQVSSPDIFAVLGGIEPGTTVFSASIIGSDRSLEIAFVLGADLRFVNVIVIENRIDL